MKKLFQWSSLSLFLFAATLGSAPLILTGCEDDNAVEVDTDGDGDNELEVDGED